MTVTSQQPWHMIGPRADRWIIVAILVYVTPIVLYNIMSFGLKPFVYAATSEKYPHMRIYGWLQARCDNHWFGYQGVIYAASTGEGQQARVCLTADGWVVIPLEDGQL